MGRSLFPVLVFGIVLIAALSAILAINYVLTPQFLTNDRNALGQMSFVRPAPEDLSHIFAPADDPFTTAQAEYFQVRYSHANDKTVLEFIITDEPGVKQYVYKEGWYTINNQWVKFTFTNTTVGGTKWIYGNASVKTEPLDVEEFTNHYALVYVCRKYSDTQQFVCGPKGLTKNPGIKNWTVTDFYTWPPQEPPTIVYTCANTPGAFCATTNTSPDANRTLFIPEYFTTSGGNTQYLVCGTGQSCFKCIDGFVNLSNGQCIGTCELQQGQFCATSSNGGTGNTTASCETGKSCFFCPSGTQRQGDNCVAITQCTPTCTSVSARQCTANTPQVCTDTDPSSATCLKWVDQTACTSTQTCSSGNCLNNCAATPGQFCASTPLNANDASGYCSGGQSCYTCQSGMTFNTATNACQTPSECTNGHTQCTPGYLSQNPQTQNARVDECVNGRWQFKDTCTTPQCNGNICGNAPSCTPSKTCAQHYPGQCGTGFSDGCTNSLTCTCSSGSCSASTGQGACSTSNSQNIKVVSMQRSTYLDPVFGVTENTIYVIACRELDTPIGANLRVRQTSSSSGQELGVSTHSTTPLPLCNDPTLQSKGFHFYYVYAFGSDAATGTRSVIAELISISAGSDSITADNTLTQTMVIG